MNVPLRQTADRVFTGLALLSVALVVLLRRKSSRLIIGPRCVPRSSPSHRMSIAPCSAIAVLKAASVLAQSATLPTDA